MAVFSKERDPVLFPLACQVDNPLGTTLYYELQPGEVGSPIRQQLHRPALQTQGLLPLCRAELTLPTLGLHLYKTDSQGLHVGFNLFNVAVHSLQLLLKGLQLLLLSCPCVLFRPTGGGQHI